LTHYTPEELRTAVEAMEALWRNEGPPPTMSEEVRAVLDAVLPGYTERIQAEALTEARDEMKAQAQHEGDPRIQAGLAKASALLGARAAALAAPVEHDRTVDGWCAVHSTKDGPVYDAPPVEQQ
jgi:hypothetical protein